MIPTRDVVTLAQARSRLTELAEEVKAGAEKLITKDGEGYVALIDAHRLDYYHRLERARIHLLLLEETERGLRDIEQGRVREATSALDARRKRRAGSG
ncbi:MAG: type II toxin-antitoxin system Phd/YefM family antitoxin [Thiobacillaceae bacterium]|nr:type II toxin-antitoxin system Phd/YefM family antitoxin [Thiobacillaceae bacterium]